MHKLFGGVYAGKTVLVTGHTGFKGSWLCLWFEPLGARVVGYALEAPTKPNHFDLLDLEITSVIGDLRDQERLERVIAEQRPEIVFHLAAQSLVRRSYEEPLETFETNVIGTLKLFEACRRSETVRAIVNITSDKAYENKEWVWGYRENDAMGGYDPYSASKGCAELLTSAYRNSYFNPLTYGDTHRILLASCRAGNVVGGGDWAEDRLICDIMRAAADNRSAAIRNPRAIRPWQHVLEPLSGYLLIGQKLLEGERSCAEGWNFAPSDEDALSVGDVVRTITPLWEQIDCTIAPLQDAPHEATLLKLDSSKAHAKLRWRDVWDAQECFKRTVRWYRDYYTSQQVNTRDDVEAYVARARDKQLVWSHS